MADEKKLIERTIPGMNRRERFVEVEHAEHAGKTVKRILGYFGKEKAAVGMMIAIVMIGTICGVYAPSLQSNSIDIIAGSRIGNLKYRCCICYVCIWFTAFASCCREL